MYRSCALSLGLPVKGMAIILPSYMQASMTFSPPSTSTRFLVRSLAYFSQTSSRGCIMSASTSSESCFLSTLKKSTSSPEEISRFSLELYSSPVGATHLYFTSIPYLSSISLVQALFSRSSPSPYPWVASLKGRTVVTVTRGSNFPSVPSAPLSALSCPSVSCSASPGPSSLFSSGLCSWPLSLASPPEPSFPLPQAARDAAKTNANNMLTIRFFILFFPFFRLTLVSAAFSIITTK